MMMDNIAIAATTDSDHQQSAAVAIAPVKGGFHLFRAVWRPARWLVYIECLSSGGVCAEQIQRGTTRIEVSTSSVATAKCS